MPDRDRAADQRMLSSRPGWDRRDSKTVVRPGPQAQVAYRLGFPIRGKAVLVRARGPFWVGALHPFVPFLLRDPIFANSNAVDRTSLS